ncbi:MAG: hypothetical protein LBF93_06665 [Zoogloeaceae bacterium]|jgi:hypothetical protein|nr:hypothetical protein [Zoogloeaceae bacterium]
MKLDELPGVRVRVLHRGSEHTARVIAPAGVRLRASSTSGAYFAVLRLAEKLFPNVLDDLFPVRTGEWRSADGGGIVRTEWRITCPAKGVE